MKIAVDAMGGDYAPKTVVEGVERARDEFSDTEYLLFGDEKQINGLLKNKDRITVVHSSEVIGMNDEPVKAVRKKKDSSLVMAAQADKKRGGGCIVFMRKYRGAADGRIADRRAHQRDSASGTALRRFQWFQERLVRLICLIQAQMPTANQNIFINMLFWENTMLKTCAA